MMKISFSLLERYPGSTEIYVTVVSHIFTDNLCYLRQLHRIQTICTLECFQVFFFTILLYYNKKKPRQNLDVSIFLAVFYNSDQKWINLLLLLGNDPP